MGSGPTAVASKHLLQCTVTLLISEGRAWPSNHCWCQ